MKKIALLCAIICASQLYSMETEQPSLFFNCIENLTNTVRHTYLYIYSFFGTTFYDSESVKALKKDINWALHKMEMTHFIPNSQARMQLNDLDNDPILFLAIILYRRDRIQEILSDLALHSSLIKKLQKAQMNGYSAISMVILSGSSFSIENNRNIIKKLMDLGFKPTEKDIMLAELKLYYAIPACEKVKMTLFLQQEDLLPEIKKNIINCMIESYREKYWLLPESNEE